jgi:Tol biopolymer transport system component/DNA-binding winged helix-turn-helix (wHTH) protein
MPDPTTLPHLVRFGIYEVNLRAGELRRDGAKIKLQEQPFKVLAMLLERSGEIVTREELEKALWSTDTFVDFEHGLNKAINKIREALDDSADNPRFVETLARRGYRFIAPLDVGAGLALPTRAQQAAPLQRRWAAALGTTALVLVIVGAIGYRHVRPAPKAPAPPMRVVPFTSFPGHEVDARFSPDGNQIAFAWDGEKEDNWDIYVKMIGEEKPLRLTTNPAADQAPAWSPDGRYIAFRRHTEAEDAIFLVPALGGPERKLHSGKSVTPFSSLLPLDWSPDGKYLVYREARPGQLSWNLSLLAIENPEDRRALTSPSGPNAMEYFPRFSPDGLNVAFVRASGPGSGDNIYVVGTAGGEPRRLTFDDAGIDGLDWTPDGAYVVFSSNRQGTYRLWKVRASGGEPEPLAVGQGGASGPSLSRDGRRLAYTQSSGDTNIWRYEVPRAPGRSTPPTKLIASTQFDGGQQFSPDGRRIVFTSTRSGSYEIWVCDRDGSNPRQLTFFGGPDTGTPRWSPDGRQIVFDSTPQGHNGIFVVSAEGGRPRRLTTESSNDCVASWSRDGRWIYFASDRTGAWQVWRMPAEGGRAVQVTKQGGFAAFESLDGKTLYYAKGHSVPGLWKVPVEGGEEMQILPQPAANWWRCWGLTAEGIYFHDASTKAIEFFSFATHKVTQIVKPDKPPGGARMGLAASSDGRWILFTQVDQEDADIMLVENFRW